MSDTQSTSSQAQQIPGMDQWKKLFDEQATRMQGMFGELERLQATWMAFGTARIDAFGELAKAQLAYAEELTTAARKLVGDATKRASELFKN